MSKNGMRKQVRPAVVKKVMERQAEKERVKVAKAIQNLSLENNPLFKGLTADLTNLVQAFNGLAGTVNNNFSAQGQALQHIDFRVVALMMVLDDLVSGGTENVTKRVVADGERIEGVAWNSYFERYRQTILEQQALGQQHVAAQQPADALITPAAAEGDAEEDSGYITTEFGGNEGVIHVEDGSPKEARATG